MESADPRSRRESPGTCYDFRAMCYGRLRSPSSALAQSGLPACTASPGACAVGAGRLRSQYRALAQPVPGACAASSSRGHRGSRRLRGGCPARAPCVLPGLPCHSGRQADTSPRLLQCGSPGYVLNANGAGSMWLLDSNGGVDIRSRARDCRGGARPPEEPLFAFRETRGLIAITPGGGRACSRSVLATTFALISRGLHAARGVLSRPA